MITERAMLAAIHISVWTAIKHDRKISREVAEQLSRVQSSLDAMLIDRPRRRILRNASAGGEA